MHCQASSKTWNYTICVANLEGTNERGRTMCGCGVLCAAEWSVTVLQSVRMCVVGGPSSERGGAVSNERGRCRVLRSLLVVVNVAWLASS